MKTVIGIDVGGSTTKIVGFQGKEMIAPQFVKASDPLTSLFGAFGKFTAENNIDLSDIEKIFLTGVGSSYITKPLYGLPCERVAEFDCIARGGIYLSGLKEAIVVSMGTGTAILYADHEGKHHYFGGTGIGGGTVVGLSRKMLGMNQIEHIVEIAKEGSLDRVDLKIKDMFDGNSALAGNMTAANFGKISDMASNGDIALSILNMVFETAAMLGIFAARSRNLHDIVLTGNLTSIPQAKPIFNDLQKIFDVNFIIPDCAQFSTAIGAALS
ncbi:MAG: type II pantothenate kinase [Clostridia bacterium]|nr:type II pantothenate kinase [Clostridia bacterium]